MVWIPLKNMSSSDWIIIPAIGENKIHVPNHQPYIYIYTYINTHITKSTIYIYSPWFYNYNYINLYFPMVFPWFFHISPVDSETTWHLPPRIPGISTFCASNWEKPLRVWRVWRPVSTSSRRQPIMTHNPIGSMYGIYTNIGGILMVNVTIYSIHGSYG